MTYRPQPLLSKRARPAPACGELVESACGAFTLVEILVAMSLALMIMTAVLTTYVSLGRNFTRSLGLTSINEPNLESQARRTLAFFMRDVRMASGISGTPSNSTVTLILPTGTGSTTVGYAYDSTNQKLFRGSPWSSSTTYVADDVVISGGTGYRCILTNSNQTPPNATYWTAALPLQSNLLSLNFRYYDVTGYPFDTNIAPYVTIANYVSGIKQLTVTFTAQAGSGTNGTLTQVYQTDSPRLIIRNKGLLQ